MSESNKASAGKGRKPLTKLERTTRRVVRAHSDLTEVEQEFNMMLGLSNSKEPSERDDEILIIANTRLKINKSLDAVLAEVYPMQRLKDKTPEVKARLKELVKKRDYMFAQLKDIPELGITQEEWDAMTIKEKAFGLGRPKVSLELRLVRARNEYKAAESEYREAEKDAGAKPVKIAQLVELRSGSFSGPGRPSGGMLTQLEKKLRVVQKEIDHIESGAAAIDVEKRRQQQMKTTHGKRMGRPFESLEDRLERFKADEQSLNERILMLENNLSDDEWIQRQISLKRKDVRAQERLIANLNLDPNVDSNEPEVQKLYQFEAALYKAEEMKERGVQRLEKPVVAERASVSKEVISSESHAAVAEQPKSLDDILRLAKKVQEAKLQASSRQSIKTVESAKSGKDKIKQSETEALKNIVAGRKNA